MSIATNYTTNSCDAWNNVDAACFVIDVPFYRRTGCFRAAHGTEHKPDLDSLFAAYRDLMRACHASPLDARYVEGAMVALGFTSRMDCADWVSRLERDCSGPVCDDRKLDKLDKIKSMFPAYFD